MALRKIKKKYFYTRRRLETWRENCLRHHAASFQAKFPSILIPFICLLMDPGKNGEKDTFKIKSSEYSFFPLFLELFIHCLIFF